MGSSQLFASSVFLGRRFDRRNREITCIRKQTRAYLWCTEEKKQPGGNRTTTWIIKEPTEDIIILGKTTIDIRHLSTSYFLLVSCGGISINLSIILQKDSQLSERSLFGTFSSPIHIIASLNLFTSELALQLQYSMTELTPNLKFL